MPVDRWALRRVALGLTALGVMALGIRARGVTTAARPPRSSSLVVAVPSAIVALLALVLVWFLVRSVRPRRKRSPDDEQVPISEQYPPSRWTRPIALLSALIVIALPVLLAWLILSTVHGPRGAGSTPTPAPATSAAPQPVDPGGSDLSTWSWVLAGAVLLGFVALVLVLRRSQPRPHREQTSWRRPAPPGHAVPARSVAGVVTTAGPAVEDPRAAVVASYREFEDAAAVYGVPVGASETARDIAEHAVADEIAPAAGITELTHLFYRARYSTHPIGSAERSRAQRLLAGLRGQMRSPR